MPTSSPDTQSFRDPTGELVRSARAGDVDAWQRLDERYRTALAIVARARIPSRARRRYETDDLLQSAFLSAYRDLDGYEYKGAGSFLAWMTRILENRLKSRVRMDHRDKRDVRRDQRFTEELSEVQAQQVAPSPSELFSRAEDSARLIEAMTDIEDELREVLVRYFFDRESLRTISSELDINIKTVQRRLARGIQAVYRRLR
jgi:RNA polymerase sigma-70 factor (ECF subfamily)